MRHHVRNRVIGASVACGLLFSSTAAGAAAASYAPPPAINPMIALSVFGSQATAATLCANSAAAATAAAGAAAAATAQAPGGCVFPVVDVAPVPVASVPIAPPPGPSGIGIWPLLGGLAAITALVLLLKKGHGSSNEPVSPA